MNKNQKHRLVKVELRVYPEPFLREILAAWAERQEDRETHDQLRAKLRLKPEPGVIDRVCYQLREGSPPCLRRPAAWADTIIPEEVVVEAGTPATPS